MLAELYGALLFGYMFRPGELRVVTESDGLAKRLDLLLLGCFGFDFDVRGKKADGGRHSLAVTSADKLSLLLDAFGYDPRSDTMLHINHALLSEECCMAAFLRGAFLTGGNCTDPEKKYHLEISTSHASVAREMITLFSEWSLAPKTLARGGHTVLYFKASEPIEDFLTTIGAPRCALTLMEIKVLKDLRNGINRKVNFETANVTRTVGAAYAQAQAIRRLQAAPVWVTLPDALKEAARLRVAYPDEALSELALRFDPPLSRSGLNHRLRKLTALAAELK